MTEWRDIPGYEGAYQVSNDGQVRSLDRVIVNGKGVARFWRGRLHRTPIRGSYPHMILADGAGNYRRAAVHILVAEAFIGPRPEGMHVAHNDGNPLNPRLENLRYATPSENEADKRIHGTNPALNKTHCPQNHPYDEANTKRNPDGSRQCRACKREQDRRYRESGRRQEIRKPVQTEALRIRTWAAENGMAVKAVGRLSRELVKSYELREISRL